MGVESKSSLDDSPAGNLHNQPMGVEMLGALVVPALKPGDLVLVEPSGPSAEESSTEWWIGWIMQPEGRQLSRLDPITPFKQATVKRVNCARSREMKQHDSFCPALTQL